MTLEDLLVDLKSRVAKLEDAMQTPHDALLWLRAKDVETTATFMARLANDMEPGTTSSR